jgi:hypothetical protein
VGFTGDRGFAGRLWPNVRRAVSYIDSLRSSTRTPEFEEGEKRAFHGLMPPSISHEGYSAKPAYSYWDDFWTLRGLKDAAWLAEVLNDPEAAAYAERRDEFRRDLAASIERAMRAHRIDFVPGAADLGDFDATSTTIAVAPVDEPGVLPRGALQRTFDRWYDFFRRRRDGRETWENYTPYELRQVGALMRMGHADRAREALDFFLGDQRPAAWRQWAEVVWRDPAAPKFIGDLPHAWVASDYARSLLDFFAYEREADSSLVIAAGVDPDWLGAPTGVSVEGLRTRYGPLTYAVRADGEVLTLTVSGVRVPPGGLYLPAPPGRRFRDWSGDGTVELERGGVRIRSVPARIELR